MATEEMLPTKQQTLHKFPKVTQKYKDRTGDICIWDVERLKYAELFRY